jgi:transketolase C-terminal domain/subunit
MQNFIEEEQSRRKGGALLVVRGQNITILASKEMVDKNIDGVENLSAAEYARQVIVQKRKLYGQDLQTVEIIPAK